MKKRRKTITLKMKLKIIAQHEGGQPVAVIPWESGVSQFSVSAILKDEGISGAVKSSVFIVKSSVVTKRAGPINDTEK